MTPRDLLETIITRFPRPGRLLGSLVLAAAFGAALPSRALSAPADEPEKGGKELVKDQPKDDKAPGDKPAGDKSTGPAVAPTTKPEAAPETKPAAGASTQPAAKLPDDITPDVKAELAAIGDAYRGLKSARLAGTISADFDVGGENRTDRGSFDATFQAPNKFRQTTKEGEKGTKVDLYVGSTGEKLYVFDPSRKYYLTADAPKDRTSADKLGKPFNVLLERQNPALLMALSADPVGELARGAKSITKADDVKVGDTSYTALRVLGEKGGDLTILVDPKTHLVRRFVNDVKKSIPPEAGEVKRAEITIDYPTIDPSADVKPEQFAWAAPEGGRDIGANPLAAADEEDEGSPAAAMEGKPAPDFKLQGADGKEIALADLKGSVVILDFWATWCGPCRASLPHLNEIYKDKKGDGLKAFAVDLREDKAKVAEFVESTKLTIPVLFDTDGKVAKQYSVTGIPQTVVVGKDGNVKKVVVGSGTHEAVRKAVEEAMK